MTRPSSRNTEAPFSDALDRVVRGEAPRLVDLVTLLGCAEAQALRLYRAADAVRRRTVGDGVHLRGLLEFSNHCRRDCGYCGLRRSHRGLERYRMEADEILYAAEGAAARGYRTLVLQSGEDPRMRPKALADLIRRIRATTGMAVTLSVGLHSDRNYGLWLDAGAERYLLRVETTDPRVWSRLRWRGSPRVRMDAVERLTDLGYQVGSGVMVGLPGQDAASLARDVMWLCRAGCGMLAVGPFIPHPDTPLGVAHGGSLSATLRVVAVLRLVQPGSMIPATTALGSLEPWGRERALSAGANVLMPNVTPRRLRPGFTIYPGKICLDEDPDDCRGCIEGRLRVIGRHPDAGRGDAPRAGTVANA